MEYIKRRFRHNIFSIIFIAITAIYGLSITSSVYAAPPLVTSSADNETTDGQCTLREAIRLVNNDAVNNDCGAFGAGVNNITFDLSVTEIIVNSPLPPLTADGVTIDGARLVTLRGTAGAGSGLQIEGANNLITRLTIVAFPENGIVITGANAIENIIQSNFIGVAIGDSDPALGNAGAGILVENGATGTLIGGSNVDFRNTIGNSGTHGVHISGIGGPTSPTDETQETFVIGNNIGINEDGTDARPNTIDGIRIDNNAHSNIIGGSGSSDLNVIAGNTGNGVVLTGNGTDNNTITGNNIGINLSNLPEPNTNGIILRDGSSNNSITLNRVESNIDIGIALQQTGTNGNNISQNIIRANGQDGIEISGGASGNGISNNDPIRDNGANGIQIADSPNNTVDTNNIRVNGTNGVLISGANATGNQIQNNMIRNNTLDGIRVENNARNNTFRRNSITNNNGLGIDLNGDGVTPNDPGDGDTGANDLLNFPVLTYAVDNGTNTTFIGTLNAANAPFRLEFFSDPVPDPSGHGEGRDFIVAFNNIANAATPTIFGTTPTGLTGSLLTATTTNTSGSTSEFAANILVEALIANFTFTTTPGSLTVPFTNTSTGNISAYSWNFGDGSPNATAQNPTHTFPAPGTYNVTLTVTHISGLVQASVTYAVTVTGTIPTNTPVNNTPTLTPSATIPTATYTASITPTRTNTPSNTPTLTLTPSNTATFTLTASNTATFTLTPSLTPSNTATNTPFPTETFTPLPSNTFTPLPTSTPLPSPTNTPVVPEIEVEKEQDDDDTFTIIITNNGGDAENVIVQEILRPEVFYVSSVPGNPLCLENSGVITCTLGAILGGESTQINITVESDGTSITSGQTIVSVDGQTQTFEEPFIVKISEPPFAAPGDTVTYTIRIINPTNRAFTAIEMNDTMPIAISITNAQASAGTVQVNGQNITFTKATLNPNERITITITGELLSTATAPEVINRACLITAETTTSRCASSGFLRASVLPRSGESQRGILNQSIFATLTAIVILLSLTGVVYFRARSR